MNTHWTRRQFIGTSLLGASGLAAPNILSSCGVRSTVPEISASVFPWDLADEGMDRVLDNLQDLAGANSIYLCNLSEEIRPFRGGEYTHNPVRKSYKCEDSHIYWPPDMQYYGKIKPLRTQREFLAGTDWVGEFINATRKRGMKSGVEFFHGFVDRSRLENQFPDSIQVDIHGEPVLTHNYNKPASCLNSPDFQEYAVGLYSDLAANYEPDYIQTCMIPYVLPTGYLTQNLPPDPIKWALIAPQKGGCFCSHCMAAAEARGFDLEAARQELLVLAGQDQEAVVASGIKAEDYLSENPILKQWLDFRCDSVNGLYSKISKAAKSLQPGIDIRWNNYIRTHGYYSGIDLPSFMDHVDSIRANAFVEHEDDPALVDEKVEHLNQFNEIVQDRVHWVAAIDIRGRNTSVLERSAELSSYTGCDGYALSHYGGATLENLKAVRRGLERSKWAEHF